MKKTLFVAATALLLTAVGAYAQMLDISEVYGGGGNSGSTYKNDFIELYNYGTTTIDMSALAVFYTSTAGTFTASAPANNFSTLLTGTLAPQSYYLIQESAGTGGTTSLSNVNVVGSIAISSTGGKVALGLASATPSSTAGAIMPDGTNLIDFLGWGTANQFEGTAAAAATANTTSTARANPGVNAFSNSTEFATGAPSPQGTGAVPEPTTYAYVIAGLGGLALVSRRRRVA